MLKNELISKNNSGLTLVETIIVIIVVFLVLIAGSVIYVNGHSAKDIILNRQKSIDSYVQHLNVSNYSSIGSTLYSKSLITTSLYNTVQGLTTSYTNGGINSTPEYVDIVCTYELPSGFSYGPVNISSDNQSASLKVNVFTPGSLNPTPYSTQWLKVNGTWQLNKANCR